MRMLRKAVFPGKYLQGPGALQKLPRLIELFGGNGLILASRSAHTKILPQCGIDLESDTVAVERFSGECCEREVTRIAKIINERDVAVVVGMGGGKTIDTAKIAADRGGIPVVVVPTIASTDAPCSGCAVLYSEQGVFQSVSYQKSNPAAVLVDTEIIANAPARFLVAGMGDALATWFESRSCHGTRSSNACGGLSTLSAVNLARLCYDTLLAHGYNARMAVERHIVTPALEHIVEANILLSGLGFESGGLASAHSIHNGLTALQETHLFYHGEKVAFGVLAGLQLVDADPAETETVYSFCEQVRLPTTLADLGVQNFDRQKLMPVAEKACAPEESIHHEAGTITPEMVVNAILAADAIGTERKSGSFAPSANDVAMRGVR